MYTVLVFSLDLYEGKVLCIRPSLAMGTHWSTLAYTCWGIRLKYTRGGGGGRQSCTHAAIVCGDLILLIKVWPFNDTQHT